MLKSVARLTAIRTWSHSLQTEMHFSPKTAFEFPDLFAEGLRNIKPIRRRLISA